MEMESLYKKRNRVPALCLVCRRRKNKCDRIRPVCGTCKKKSISHLCFYESDKSKPENYDESPNQNQNGLPSPYQPNQAVIQNPNVQNIQNQPSINHIQNQNVQNVQNQNPPNHIQNPPNHIQNPPSHINQPPSHQPLHQSPLHQYNLPIHHYSPHKPLKLSLPSPGLFPRQHLPPPSRYGMHQSYDHSYRSDSKSGPNTGPNTGSTASNSGSHQGSNPGSNPGSMSGSMSGMSGPLYGSVSGPSGPISAISGPNSGPIPAPMAGSIPGSVGSVGSIPGSAGAPLASPAQNLPAVDDPKILPPLGYGSPGAMAPRNESQSSKLGASPYDPHAGLTTNVAVGTTPGTSPESTRSYGSNRGSHAGSHKSVQLPPLQDTRLVAVPIGSNSVLRINPDDAMDVFSNASYSLMVEGSIWSQQGPLSYIGLVKSDPFMKLIRHYTITMFMSGEMSQFIHKDRIKRRETANKRRKRSSISDLKSEANASKDTSADASPSSQAGDDDVRGSDSLIVTKIGVQAEENEESGSSTPPLFPGLHRLTGLKREYYKIVEQAAIDILPPKHIAAMLFFQFVKYVQPFIPIISESTILIDVRPVMPGFPEFKDEKFLSLAIKSDHSLHVLGIFLLVLRLGYMSLVHTNEVQYSKDELTMISYMRSIANRRYMAVVGICLPDGLTTMSLSKCSFKELQCLTLLHFYRQVAPDDGHGLGGADSQVLLGTIIRQAISIGLNRDPSKYEAHENIRKQTNLVTDWRNLWSYLCDVDAVLAMHCGSIPNLPSLELSDVRPSEFENKLGQVDLVMANIKAINAVYRRICNMITDVQKLPKIVDILLKANELEKIFLDFFGKDFFNEYICNPHANAKSSLEMGIGSTEYELLYLKVIKFNTFIQLRNNLSCLYYKVAIHYEQQYDKMGTPSMMAAIELFKIFVKSVVQLVYIMSYTLDHLVELFGRCYDFILTANNERCMIKTHNFIASFFIRLIHHKKVLDDRCKAAKESGVPDEATVQRAQVIDDLFQMIIVEAELFVGNFRKLSRTYINSYRLYVMTYLVLKQCMEDVEVFFEITGDSLYHSGTNMLEFFTHEELEHLQKLCEEFRFAKHKNEERHRKRELAESSHPHFNAETMPLGEDASNIVSSPDDPFMNMNMQDMGTDMMTNDDIVRLFDMYGDVDRPAWSDL